MADRLFPLGRSSFAKGEIDWDSDTLTVALVDDTYTFDGLHQYADDITGVLGTGNLTGATVLDDGVCDADDISISGVGVGLEMVALVIYQNTGTPSTSRLIYFADTNNDTTPISRISDGSPIPVIWSDEPSRIFKL